MLKKIIALAVAAMAFGAITAPLASANWTDHGNKIPPGVNPQVQLTGQTAFTSAIAGGIECQVDIKLQLTGGTTTGTVDSHEVDLTEVSSTTTQKCNTLPPLSPCVVTSAQSTGLPWIIHSNGADTITITTGQVHYVLETTEHKACNVVQSVTLEPGTASATVTAGETSAIQQLHLSGQKSTSTGTKVQIHGTQTIQAPNAGTYGTA